MSVHDNLSSNWLTSWVELHELEILVGQIRPGDHGGTVTSASVRRGAREVGPSVSTGGQNRVLGSETMQGAVLQAQGNHAPTFAVFHQEVQGEVLDEVVAVVAQRLSVQGV